MKSRFLFPHKWRVAGFVLLLLASIMMLYNNLTSGGIAASTNLDGGFFGKPASQQIAVASNDVEYLAVIIGLLLVGFSKEKVEDEQIAQLRLDSLQWAVYVNYSILIVCIIFINGLDFLSVMAYNIMSQLLFFIIRFRWKVYQLTRQLKRDELITLNLIN
jgi:hypothetical protein